MTTIPNVSVGVPSHQSLLTVPEVSAYLGIKSKTLYAKIGAGEIPHYRLGRLIRFRMDEINAWLERCRKDGSLTPGQSPGRNRKKPSRASDNQMSAIIAKTIDEERGKYYAADHGKSDRIEGLGKEAPNGTV